MKEREYMYMNIHYKVFTWWFLVELLALAIGGTWLTLVFGPVVYAFGLLYFIGKYVGWTSAKRLVNGTPIPLVFDDGYEVDLGELPNYDD